MLQNQNLFIFLFPVHVSLLMNYGAFRLSFCISQHQLVLVYCMATHVMRTNNRNAQSCCERLASADVDWWTAMTSECTITLKVPLHHTYILYNFSFNLQPPQLRAHSHTTPDKAFTKLTNKGIYTNMVTLMDSRSKAESVTSTRRVTNKALNKQYYGIKQSKLHTK